MRINEHQVYVADFETTTANYSTDYTKVYLYGLIGVLQDDDKIKIGYNINDFMQNLINDTNIRIVYFHNAKFDVSFILSWLFLNGYKHEILYSFNQEMSYKSFSLFMTDTGVFYNLKINFETHVVEIRDSYKLIQSSLEDMAKAFTTRQKLSIDYDIKDIDNLPFDYIKYQKGDVFILRDVVRYLFLEGFKSLTISSESMKQFKKTISTNFKFANDRFLKKFPKLETNVDKDLRHAYNGGISYVAEGKAEKEFDNVVSYDVNSLYPSVMYNDFLPYGYPLIKNGKPEIDNSYLYDKSKIPNFLWVAKIILTCSLKVGHVPTIKKRNHFFNGDNFFKDCNLTELYITNVDYEMIYQNYNVYDIQFIYYYQFKCSNANFKNYIDKWREIKENNKGAKREMAKRFLNHLYGKFGSNPYNASKIPYFENGVVKYKNVVLGEKETIYLPVAIFTTSNARFRLTSAINKNLDAFIYCDTDSMYLEYRDSYDLDIHDTHFGFWKKEHEFKKIKFIKQKSYIGILPNNELYIKCAGLTSRQHKLVTFDNFKKGAIFTNKLMPKTIKGGIILEETTFEIK